ncbi:MAG: tRNA(Ile)-lysidine synthase [Pseudomonadota bacterium]|jgi:tRNA(Ile)-lysidine synthase
MNELVNFLEQSFLKQKLKKNCHLLVGVSGGIDSVVLGHSLSQLRSQYPFDLTFIYVDHQLHPESKEWANTVKQLAKKLSTDYIYEKVLIDQDLKLGTEGAARKHRYQAFRKHQQDILVLAQHEDDQLETLLLQLARGAGLKGLSCMPEYHKNLKIWRPLLGVCKELIYDYQQQHKLKFIEDSSNLDDKYDRNYLRNKVIPLVKKRFPQFATTSGRSVKHIADGYNYQNLMHAELYESVLEGTNQLNGLKLKKLSDYDMGNVIRFWLNEHQALMPSIKILEQIISQVKKIHSESNIKIKVDHFYICSFNQLLYLVKNNDVPFKKVIWNKQNKMILDHNRMIIVRNETDQGIHQEILKKNVIEIDQPRIMSAKVKIHPQQPARTLQYIFQQNKIPPWERKNYPVVYLNNKVVSIPGIATDINYLCKNDEAGLSFEIRII